MISGSDDSGTLNSLSNSRSQTPWLRFNNCVRDALLKSVTNRLPPVKFQTSHESTVPIHSPPESASFRRSGRLSTRSGGLLRPRCLPGCRFNPSAGKLQHRSSVISRFAGREADAFRADRKTHQRPDRFQGTRTCSRSTALHWWSESGCLMFCMMSVVVVPLNPSVLDHDLATRGQPPPRRNAALQLE